MSTAAASRIGQECYFSLEAFLEESATSPYPDWKIEVEADDIEFNAKGEVCNGLIVLAKTDGVEIGIVVNLVEAMVHASTDGASLSYVLDKGQASRARAIIAHHTGALWGHPDDEEFDDTPELHVEEAPASLTPEEVSLVIGEVEVDKQFIQILVGKAVFDWSRRFDVRTRPIDPSELSYETFSAWRAACGVASIKGQPEPRSPQGHPVEIIDLVGEHYDLEVEAIRKDAAAREEVGSDA